MAWDWLRNLVLGRDPSIEQASTVTSQQQQGTNNFINQAGGQGNALFGAGSSFLQNLLSGDPSAYAAFEQPLMTQFNQQIIPGIAERFAGQGTGAGALSSSALHQSLGQAGRNLQGDIGALRGQLGMQAANTSSNYISQLLQALGTPQFENIYEQGGPGMLHSFAQGAGQAIGTYATGGSNLVAGAAKTAAAGAAGR